MTTEIPTVGSVLRANGHSLTKARQAVFNAMVDSGPLSMGQLTNKVHSRIDRASVYRTIALFEKLGIVNRLQLGWKYRLELSDLFTDHHHHATCVQCGTVIAFEESAVLDKEMQRVGKALNFAITSHALEICGLCARCRTS